MAYRPKFVRTENRTNKFGRPMKTIPRQHRWYHDMPRIAFTDIPDENWIRAFGSLNTRGESE